MKFKKVFLLVILFALSFSAIGCDLSNFGNFGFGDLVDDGDEDDSKEDSRKEDQKKDDHQTGEKDHYFLQLNVENIKLNVGQIYDIPVSYEGTISYRVTDTSVIAIVDNKVIALNEGSVTVVVTIEENPNLIAFLKVDVINDDVPTGYFLDIIESEITITVGSICEAPISYNGKLDYIIDNKNVISFDGNQIWALHEGTTGIKISLVEDPSVIGVLIVHVIPKASDYYLNNLGQTVYTVYLNDYVPLILDMNGTLGIEYSKENIVKVTGTKVLGIATGYTDLKLYIVENPYIYVVIRIVVEDPNSTSYYPLANGYRSYTDLSNEDKTKLLGLLEKYAIENGLTGLTLYETCESKLFNVNLELGSFEYIADYGYGEIAEGVLRGTFNDEYPEYYHSYVHYAPGNVISTFYNDYDAQDIYKYISANYFGKRLDSEYRNKFQWFSELAIADEGEFISLYPDDDSDTTLHTKWKFNVKTDGLLYSTKSTKFASYNGRKVNPEDYITPYKMAFMQCYNLQYPLNYINQDYEIKGLSQYYYATENGFDEEAWNNVGISIEDDDSDGVWTMHFEFNNAFDKDQAMYYISQYCLSPVPEDFINDIGGFEYYGSIDSDNGYVDTYLSTGPYVISKSGDSIVLVRNSYYENAGRYQIKGICYKVLNSYENPVYGFLMGEYSECSVNKDDILNYNLEDGGVSPYNVYVNYYLKKNTTNSQTYRLNVNLLDQETWKEFFGENGRVQYTSEEEYWECEPILSDHNFYLGMSYAINRNDFAKIMGGSPTVNYFGNEYSYDYVNGYSYNRTYEHHQAISSLIQDDNGGGYDITLARAYFREAALNALEKGYYKEGDVIHLEIAWQKPEDKEQYHNYIKAYLEDAFNNPTVCDGKLTLSVDFWCGEVWSDVYYQKMFTGQFDLAFGGISGDMHNPISLLETLESSMSSGFTTCWSIDTSIPSEDLIYDGLCWSFEGLVTAITKGAYFIEGKEVPMISPEYKNTKVNNDGSQTITFMLNPVSYDFDFNIDAIMIYSYLSDGNYSEDNCEFISYSKYTGELIFKVSADLCEKYSIENIYMNDPTYYNGFDIYIGNNYFTVWNWLCYEDKEEPIQYRYDIQDIDCGNISYTEYYDTNISNNPISVFKYPEKQGGQVNFKYIFTVDTNCYWKLVFRLSKELALYDAIVTISINGEDIIYDCNEYAFGYWDTYEMYLKKGVNEVKIVVDVRNVDDIVEDRLFEIAVATEVVPLY